MGSRRAHWCPPVSSEQEQEATVHRRTTTQDWKNISCSDESQRSDGQSRIWCKQHGGMDPPQLVSVLQAAADGVMGGHILGLLVPIEDHLNVAAYLSLIADLTATSGFFQQDNGPCHKAQITSTAFWNMTMSSLCEMKRVVLSPGTER